MTDRRKEIDLLIEQLWKRGYLTLSRKYGTYLPEPSSIGGFEVDIIARLRNSYAIGITLNRDDLKDPSTLNKLKYLATRKNRNSSKKVSLFIGVQKQDFSIARKMISRIEEDVRKNIRLSVIEERPVTIVKSESKQLLFS